RRLATRPPDHSRRAPGLRQPRRHLPRGGVRRGSGPVRRLGHAVSHRGLAPSAGDGGGGGGGGGGDERGVRRLSARERRPPRRRAAVRRVWPRLRPRHRAAARAWRPAGHRLPRRCEGRYTTSRARPGVWRPGRPVFQRQHSRGLGTGGGGVAATRMISIIGRKNAGKTTLLVALSAELVRRKFRVMTIKHGTHPADTDQRGKDSWRHWHEGRAERVLMEGPGQRVLWEKTEK